MGIKRQLNRFLKLVFCVSIVLNSQFTIPNEANAQTSDTNRLSLNVDGRLFFVDNEYAGSQLDGYTLPGFTLRPTVTWRIDRRVRLQAGVNWLNYWGNHGFPQGPLNEVFPAASDTASSLHLTPWMQVRVDLAPWLGIVLGSLESSGHSLPLPLYNSERVYATDPEAGAQLLVNSRYMDIDAWVDWRDFIWYSSKSQERFNCGVSLSPHYDGAQWHFALPLHAVVQHHGGEGLADTTLGHTTFFNCAAGARAAYCSGRLTLGLDAYAMTYSRTGPDEGTFVYNEWGCLIEPPPSFKRGNGTLVSLAAGWDSTKVDLNYWTGDKFVPLLGSYLFSNLSANIEDMTHRRFQMLMLRGRHVWSFTDCELHLQLSYIHTFAHAADRLDYWPCSMEAEDMFTVGLLFHFHPSIALYK